MSSKRKNLAWLIPLIATLLVVLLGIFIRFMVGSGSEQQWDYGYEDHVPGASPFSTGPESR